MNTLPGLTAPNSSSTELMTERMLSAVCFSFTTLVARTCLYMPFISDVDVLSGDGNVAVVRVLMGPEISRDTRPLN